MRKYLSTTFYFRLQYLYLELNKLQNVTKIPFFWLVTLWYPGGDIDKIYILSKSRGLVAAKPFLRRKKKQKKKKTFFPFLYCFFFFTFQDENSQKERYGNERRYKFYFFFLFGNFLLKCEKKQWKGKMIFFSKRAGGIGLCSYKPLWSRHSGLKQLLS